MNENPIFAFVLMPFEGKFDDVYKLGIKAAAAQVGVVAERLDEQMFVEGMLERVYRQIETADIIIADMTGKNPNVFYEVGFAHAKEKMCILITDTANDIPFDLKHQRHVVYNGKISTLKTELVKNLKWAKTEVENVRSRKLRVVNKEIAYLDVDDYSAKGTVNFQFDIYNDSNASIEIHNAYFYLGNDWGLVQKNIECGKTDSDLPPYTYRYYIEPPVKTMAPMAWAQIKLKGRRTLALKWRGDEIKEQYFVSGHCTLRFVTSQGIMDFHRDLKINFDVVPF